MRLSAAPRRLTSLAARRASPVEMLASGAQWSQGPSTARRAVRGGLSSGGREGLGGAAAKGSGAEAGQAGQAREAIKVLARDLALLALGEVTGQLETSSAELNQQLQRVLSKSPGSRAASRSGRGAPPLASPWENCPLERKRSLVELRPDGMGSTLGFLCSPAGRHARRVTFTER